MKKKIIAFDTETGSTNPSTGALLTFAGAILIDDVVQEWFDFKIRPVPGDQIEKEALEVNNLDLNTVMQFPEAGQVLYSKIIPMLDRYVNKYDKADKFYPLGYNVQFDLNFLNSFFKKLGVKFGTGSYINWAFLDIIVPVNAMCYSGQLKIPDRKLATVCRHMNIHLDAHNALSDIKATLQLAQLITGFGRKFQLEKE